MYEKEREREDIQLEKEISDRIERERERTSECVLMIIMFDNTDWSGKKNHLIDHYYLSLMFSCFKMNVESFS